MEPHPVAVGLLLAERIIIDEATRNPSIIGNFTGLELEQFPSSPQRFSAWATLTNGTGHGTIELRGLSQRTGEEVYSQRGTVRFSDWTDFVNVSFRVRTIRFPHAGYYLFRIFVDDLAVPYASCRLRVYQAKVTE